MNPEYAAPFSDLRWHRLSVTLMNIRSLPTMCANSFSVFQAIIKGVSLPISSRPSERSEMTDKALQDACLIEEKAHEPLIIFHAMGRKHSFKMREYDRISLEIYFFRKGREYVRQWRDAFQTYLSDSVTGRNFEIVEMGAVEERNFGQVVRERDIQYAEGEICLEFLTPFPFKPEKGKPRTYISKTAFIRSFERRFSRCLAGRSFIAVRMISFPSFRTTGTTQRSDTPQYLSPGRRSTSMGMRVNST